MGYESARNILFQKVKNFFGLDFETLALEVFRFQARYNALYAQYLQLIKADQQSVSTLAEIPFFPVGFFKNYKVKTGNWPPEIIFSSSGTMGSVVSKHFIRERSWYRGVSHFAFEKFYGAPGRYCILALLPSYLERSDSSLVYMADYFIKLSAYEDSGFFLYNTEDLIRILKACKKNKTPTLLLGVSFALLELAERYPMDLQGVIIMETGGMKGKRSELIREELHQALMEAFNVKSIHSEYGMTELLSQAYSKEKGRFYPSPLMKIMCREVTDPFSLQKEGRTGAINIIDLANIDSMSFIATDDLGKAHADGSFEVLGRLDASDIRGCNLMVE